MSDAGRARGVTRDVSERDLFAFHHGSLDRVEMFRPRDHADIVRESVDGTTAFPLLAAAEGWPATAWMQPWQKVR